MCDQLSWAGLLQGSVRLRNLNLSVVSFVSSLRSPAVSQLRPKQWTQSGEPDWSLNWRPTLSSLHQPISQYNLNHKMPRALQPLAFVYVVCFMSLLTRPNLTPPDWSKGIIRNKNQRVKLCQSRGAPCEPSPMPLQLLPAGCRMEIISWQVGLSWW